MPKGVIKFFSEKRGYGFIAFKTVTGTHEPNDEDGVFVHHSQIKDDGYRTLVEGQEVVFDLKESKHGLEAINVKKLS